MQNSCNQENGNINVSKYFSEINFIVNIVDL